VANRVTDVIQFRVDRVSHFAPTNNQRQHGNRNNEYQLD
jgi:hypothetical protein